MRVLLVEDHAKLAMTMATGLRQAGMAVDVVFDGQDALDHLALTAYDVVVLDRDIPGVHGDDVCKALAAEGSPSRVLMLTAAGTVEDRVEGLGIGADDYLPKPCDFTELVARIRALVRRPGTALPPTLTHGDLQLDPSHRIATRAGRPLPLNPKEFAVLEVLLTSARRRRVRRGDPRTRLGRGSRPLQPSGQDHHQPPPRQARRPATDRDGGQGRLPDRRLTHGAARRLRDLAFGSDLRRRSARFRLTALYCCLFFPSGVVLVFITYFLIVLVRAPRARPTSRRYKGRLMRGRRSAGAAWSQHGPRR